MLRRDADRCLENHALERYAPRWDYVLVGLGAGNRGIGMEVHPAIASEVEGMIAKKAWAEALLRKECRLLSIEKWHWVAPPAGDGQPGQVFFLRTTPGARALTEAGIEFPQRQVVVPV